MTCLTQGHMASEWPAVIGSCVYLALQSLHLVVELYCLWGLVSMLSLLLIMCWVHRGLWWPRSTCTTKHKEGTLGQAQVSWGPRKKLDWLRLPMRPAIPQGNFCCIQFLQVALCKVVIVKLGLVWGLCSSQSKPSFLHNSPHSPAPPEGKLQSLISMKRDIRLWFPYHGSPLFIL